MINHLEDRNSGWFPPDFSILFFFSSEYWFLYCHPASLVISYGLGFNGLCVHILQLLRTIIPLYFLPWRRWQPSKSGCLISGFSWHTNSVDVKSFMIRAQSTFYWQRKSFSFCVHCSENFSSFSQSLVSTARFDAGQKPNQITKRVVDSRSILLSIRKKNNFFNTFSHGHSTSYIIVLASCRITFLSNSFISLRLCSLNRLAIKYGVMAIAKVTARWWTHLSWHFLRDPLAMDLCLINVWHNFWHLRYMCTREELLKPFGVCDALLSNLNSLISDINVTTFVYDLLILIVR